MSVVEKKKKQKGGGCEDCSAKHDATTLHGQKYMDTPDHVLLGLFFILWDSENKS